MASLNLVDWRSPTFAVVLRRQLKPFCYLASVCTLITAFYVSQFQSHISQLQSLRDKQTIALRDYSALETLALQQLAEQQSRATAMQHHRHHASTLAAFITLLQLDTGAVSVTTISWLSQELKVSGNYTKTEDIKQLQKTLFALLPTLTSSVQFIAPKRFSITVDVAEQ